MPVRKIRICTPLFQTRSDTLDTMPPTVLTRPSGMPERISVSISTVALKIPAESPRAERDTGHAGVDNRRSLPEVTMTGRKRWHDAAPPELLPQNNGHQNRLEQQDNRNLVEHGG